MYEKSTGMGFCEQCHVNYGELRYYVPGVVAGFFVTFLIMLTTLARNLGWVIALFSGAVAMLLCAGLGPLFSTAIQACDGSGRTGGVDMVPLKYDYDEL